MRRVFILLLAQLLLSKAMCEGELDGLQGA